MDASAEGEDVESASRNPIRDAPAALWRLARGVNADGAFRAGALEAREEVLARFDFLGLIRKGKFLGGEPRLQVAANGGPGKIVNVRGDAVRRQNGEALAVGVDEGHHDAFERRVGIYFAGTGAARVAVSKRGFIAVMAVSDDQLLVRHGVLNFRDAVRT